MNKKHLFLLLAGVSLSLTSCKKEEKADPLVVEESYANETNTALSAPIESPQDLIAKAQSSPLTNIVLAQSHFDFGKIKHGEVVSHTYEITNTGKNPLILSQVIPGCGCTVPEFTKEPILPGESGKITLKFDSNGFQNIINKQAEIYANTEKAPIIITFSADIQN